MRNVMRTGFVRNFALAAGMLSLLGGCNCGDTKVQCPDIQVKFDSPDENASVNAPFTASISAVGPDGTAVSFDTAKLTLDGKSYDGTVTNASASFSGLTAAGGKQTMIASITRGSCSADATDATNKIPTASRSVTVVPPCTPKVSMVVFPQDLNGDKVLNSVELPSGTAMQVKVTATCVDATKVQIKKGTTVVGPATDFASGIATVSVPVTGDDTFDLFAELVRGGAAVNTPAANAEALASIKVIRATPSCSNTTVLKNGPNTDQTAGNMTFDLRATGEVGSSVVSAFFRIENGASSTPGAPAMGAVTADFALPKTTVTYNVILEASDQYGNVCRDTKAVSVDYTPLVVTITAPATDGGVASTSTTPISVVATVTKGGQPYACVANDAGTAFSNCAIASRTAGTGAPVEVDSSDVVAGSTTLTVPFPASGSYSIRIDVTDDLGNTGADTVRVDAALTQCGVEFTTPGMCPMTIFASNLVNGNYPVSFRSPNCVGHATRLKVGGVVRGSGTIPANGIYGPTAVPFASSGTVTMTAEVDNTVGMPTQVDCVVTADLSQVLITSPVPVAPATQVTVNASQDASGTTPGAQRTLAFTAGIPAGSRADVCTTQAVDPVTTQNRTACADGATGWYLLQSNVVTPNPANSNYTVGGFTFPEGSYSIKVVVASSTSTNVSPPVPLVVDVTRPCVASAGLSFDRDTGAGNPMYAADGRLNIAEYALTAPFLSFALGCGDTAATLSATNPVSVQQIVNNAPAALPGGASATITTAAGRYNANVAGLTGNSVLTFWVQLTDAVGNTSQYQGSLDTARKTLGLALTAPACTIATPSASLLGKAQVPGGNLTVSVSTDTTTVGTNGVKVDLGGPSPASQMLTPVTGTATALFGGITGDHPWTLAASCTDVAGNLVNASGRSVQIDLVDPTISFQSPVNNGQYTSLAIPTTLNVTGADGQMVRVAVGAQTISSMTVVSGVATDTTTQYPKGPNEIVTGTVQDLAGNQATATITITVNDTACTLTQTNVFPAGGKAYINRALAPGGVANLTATSDCVNSAVALNLLDGGGNPINPPAASGTSDGSGVISFSGRTVTDGQVYRVTIDNGAGLKTFRDYTIDVVAPTVTFVSPLPNGLYTSLSIPTTVNVTGADGQTVTVNSTLRSPVTTPVVVGGVASDPSSQYPKGAQTVTASVSDVAGNSGTASINITVNDAACTLTPTNIYAANGKFYINQALAPGGVANFTATSDCNSAVVTLNLLDGGGNPINPPAASGSSSGAGAVAFNGQTVADGQVYRITIDNGAGLKTTRDYTIDILGPVITFVSPTAGAPSNGKYSTTSIATTINATGAEGQTLTVISSAQVAAITSGAVTGGVLSNPSTSYPRGTQTLTASATDVAGNPGSASISITVNDVPCSLTPSGVLSAGGKFYINRAAAPSGMANFTGTTDCQTAAVTLSLLDAGGNPIAPPVATGNAVGGAIAFNGQTVTDGQVYRVAVDNGGGLLTTKDYVIDIIAPTFTSYTLSSGSGCPSSTPCTTTSAAPTTNLYFVAATTNRNVYANPSGAAAAGYLPDSAPANPGADFFATVNGAHGVAGGLVQIRYRGTTFGTVNVPVSQTAATDIPLGTAFGQPASQVNLPQVVPAAASAFSIELVDVAGNATTVYSAASATVDVVAPNDPAAQFGTVTHVGQMPITWTTVYGDGADQNSGSVTYEVVWSTSSVPGNNALGTESNYMSAGTASAVSTREQDSLASTGTTVSLPPINTYYVAVRARDGVGNLSPFVAPSAPYPAQLWTSVTLQDSNSGSGFGTTVAASDVVGNTGVKDIIVGAAGGATGTVYIYAGGGALADQTGCPAATCQALTPPDGVGPGFGSDLSADGNVGEPGNDLLVSQPRWVGGGTATAQFGRVFLFFGTTAATISTAANQFVEFRGDASNPQYGLSAKIIPSIDGDALDEVMISSPYWDFASASLTAQSVSRVYIFKGRPLAEWLIPGATSIANATWVIEGPIPRNGMGVAFAAGSPPTGNGLGLARTGITALGDVDGDGRPDIGIPMSQESSNIYQLWSGRTIASAVAPLSATGNLRQFTATQNPTNGTASGIGQASVGNVNLVDAGVVVNSVPVRDLVASYPGQNQVRIYGGAIANGGNPFLMINGQNRIGTAVAVADLNGDQRADVVAAEGLAAPFGTWVLYQQPTGAFELNCTANSQLCVGGTNVAFWAAVVRGTGTSRMGAYLSAADVSGDNAPDLLLGDPVGRFVRILK